MTRHSTPPHDQDRDRQFDLEHDVEVSPAGTSAYEWINTEPDPAWCLDCSGGGGPPGHADGRPGPVRILGIGGTTGEKPWSVVPLDAALERARERGCDVVRATVHDLDLPMFRTDWKLEDYPPSLPWLLD